MQPKTNKEGAEDKTSPALIWRSSTNPLQKAYKRRGLFSLVQPTQTPQI